ncbi:MAG: S9 family peptidase, partial [Candidatus Eisenbacteria bacterium]|nr:S9 family peptidase [Candidatus Eisenbacteria bacterium]
MNRASAPAESSEAVYKMPDQALVDIIDAPKTPSLNIAPDREWAVLIKRPGYPSIAELAEPELRLAGLRIKPDNHSPSRVWPNNELEFLRIEDGWSRRIDGLPVNPRITNISWSPDGEHLAFTNTTPDGVELWVADLETSQARRLTDPIVSLAADNGPEWMSDSRTLVCCLVSDHGPAPKAPRVPAGPVIQKSLGETAPARTYRDLLQNPYDEELFDYYLTSQLALVGLDGSFITLGEPAVIWGFRSSPDGRYFIVHTLHRPYSYMVPASRFPELIEIWDADGNVVHRVADQPLRDNIPISRGSVETGPRYVDWRADAPATLCWVEALDGGDAGAEAEFRDRVFMLEAPFDAEPVELITLELRFSEIDWGHDELAVASEWWWHDRRIRVWKVQPGSPEDSPELLMD